MTVTIMLLFLLNEFYQLNLNSSILMKLTVPFDYCYDIQADSVSE
ncbi:hypothetical protein [Niallia sp. MER TA 168]|nr:hypothetical protein [Niallia sp. MER TA 168]